jgi:hypothetical protein
MRLIRIFTTGSVNSKVQESVQVASTHILEQYSIIAVFGRLGSGIRRHTYLLASHPQEIVTN